MTRRAFFWVSLVVCVVGAMVVTPGVSVILDFPPTLVYCALCALGGAATAAAEHAIFGLPE